MLNYIKTQNFKKLGNFNATFTDGTNLILGDNGRGKSTVFTAVRFALFGVSSIASSTENVATWGESNSIVELGFNGYKVIRTLKDAKVFNPEGEKVAEGNKPCSEWVKNYLGLDHKMFSIFNMSMQGETGALISKGATELNRIVEEYSGVLVIDKVISSLSTENTLLTGELKALEFIDTGDLEKEVETLESDTQAAQNEYDKNMEQFKSLREEGKLLSDNLKQLKTFNDEVEETERKLLASKERLSEKLEQKVALEKSLDEVNSKLVDIDEVSKELADLKEKLAEFNSDDRTYDKVEASVKNYQGQIENFLEMAEKEETIAKKRIELKSRVSEMELKVGTAKEELSSCLFKTNRAIAELAEAKQELDSGICSACGRAFENFDEDEIKEKISDLSSKVNALRKDESTVSADVKSLESKLHALNASIDQLPNYGSGNAKKAEDLKADVDNMNKTLESLEAKWETFDVESVEERVKELSETVARQLNYVEQVEEKMFELSTLSVTLKGLKESIESINVPQKKSTSDLEDRIAKIDLEMEPLVALMPKLSEKLNDVKENFAVKNEMLKSQTKENETYLDRTKCQDRVNRLTKFLRNRRSAYMEGVWSSILGVASRWIDQTTNGWITEVGRGAKGEFTFTENGVVAPAHSEASGAQKEFIGVALRLGLTSCLHGDTGLLMLDEPTAGMREENADALALGLLGVEGQKIIITHRQSERLTAANIITIE